MLSILILTGVIISIIIDYFPPKNNTDIAEFEMALEEWENSQIDTENTLSLFLFNPNTISEKLLDSLLLPTYVKRNLVNYRNAGGKIKRISDFRKIYGMNDSIYSVIKDYIIVPKTEQVAKKYIPNTTSKHETENLNLVEENEATSFQQSSPVFVVELNSADSTELVRLSGVGPVFASRIVKYRNLLGGFYRKEQLLEVYNFPEETYETLANNISVDSSAINQIRLNFADFSDLLRHPYLNKKQVQTIINYRTTNGTLKSVEDLFLMNLIDSVTFIKVSPYLSCR
ncbi:helix-hairpin-helix domain-containing protein [Maribellus maritimus]|uniref:helix-hairpin-helix domain-containing protein n=1 Tax=Maribellus maritimus TaxID=2870838 RepID=UPI001EEB6677|nr:helix-hairpin-helix domain-containing protein [Maribellus maritimus]